MLIGTPKEIKSQEYRVGLMPSSVVELKHHGHEVMIETGAGAGIGIDDADYSRAGAEIFDTPEQIFAKADMIVKVKEPQAGEYQQLRAGQILFTYLHLAADRPQTDGLLKSGVTAIAYETITSPKGGLPLLAPMSEVAGRISIHVGAAALHRPLGGRGVLLGGVPGVLPGKVLIIGGGVVGMNAAQMAMGLGADVTILDKNLEKMAHLDQLYGQKIKTKYATLDGITTLSQTADLIIGAVLIPGAAAPKLITKAHLKNMRKGAVLVDVAIDQGGCFETSKPTTHEDPTYVVDDIVHYCVANMPGAVARTSTFALTNATLPYIIKLADLGWHEFCTSDPHCANGLNTHEGKLYVQAIADAHDMRSLMTRL